MKLWKKILIGVFVLAVVAVGVTGFGLFKGYQAYKEKIEPDMKRYVTMTQQEQDAYVMSKMGDFCDFLYQRQSSDEKRSRLEAMENDPAVRRAALVWGRGICAAIIKDNWSISSTLSAADRAKYEREADDLDDKGERMQKEMQRFLLGR